MQEPISIILVGASGKVGSRIDALASQHDDLKIHARVDRDRPHADAEGAPHRNREILVDFSHFEALERSVELARKRGAALLVGTTGLDDAHHRSLAELAETVPVLVAPNTSVGCVVLIEVVEKMARALGKKFLPSIVEWHREGKIDAPSGTARALTLRLQDASPQAAALGPRAVASIRAGGVVGEHLIRFDGPDETIELVHRAHSRDVFALGALRAATWLVDQPPGRYAMIDVLGLDPGSP